jgi:hypothetical protein
MSKEEMKRFRIMTPIFTAIVPEADYGRSVKDFLEESFAPGTYPAIVEGYFILVELDPGDHLINSHASAPRERKGPYFAELLYQIYVDNAARSESTGILTTRPPRTQAIMTKFIKEKLDSGEISPKDFKNIMAWTGLPDYLEKAKERKS